MRLIIEEIKKAQKESGLKQKYIAEKAGITSSTIRNLYKNGSCSFLSIIKICEILNLEIKIIKK